VRVVLVSAYELGHQPLHAASPASALLRAGHEVRCMDLAVDPIDRDMLSWAEAVACSVPMHTAMRVARRACVEIRAQRREVALCLYGLYAGLDGAQGAPRVADLAIAGEYEPRLVAWVDSLAASAPSPGGVELAGIGPTVVELGRGRFGLPARHLLPGLERYARLALGPERHLAGYVEASHGCAHRCRHCPVPVVYDGRTRLVAEDAVLADVAQLVEMGTRHITFGDPDFLNGPHHGARVMDAVHGDFPDLTFDVTVKVEHILRHREIWPRMRAAGCLFAVSAFESATDEILDHLDKGHAVGEETEAVGVLRSAGIEPRPSLLPFTPWTRPTDVFALLDLVARCDLIGNVDPVQYAIRLLVPPGSLLVTSGRLDGRLDDYDDEHLGWTWRAPDPRLDHLQEVFTDIAQRSAAEQWPAQESYDAVRAGAVAVLGRETPSTARPPEPDRRLRSPIPADDRPRLTEAWFCCAEPSSAQLAAVEVPEWAAPVAAGGK
jgi:radical SAM superfamily enzyme YgiQ (UPF0313 family)